MPAPTSLASWLQPSSSTKRKRIVDDEDLDATSDKENIDAAPKAKQRKSKKSSALKSIAPKVNKEALKLYTNTIKAIDKRVDQLDRQVKKIQVGNSYAITTVTYAKAVMQHLAAAEKLTGMDEKLAFNLLLSMADASHCADLDATVKMCGVGDGEAVFESLDDALLPLIAQREKPILAESEAKLPRVPHRWTSADADVGEFKTGRPNKQQRNWMYSQKLEWEKDRRLARRQRRETVEDWMSVALSDLKEERDYLEKYGVKGYFPRSIAKLEELSSAEGE